MLAMRQLPLPPDDNDVLLLPLSPPPLAPEPVSAPDKYSTTNVSLGDHMRSLVYVSRVDVSAQASFVPTSALSCVTYVTYESVFVGPGRG